MGSIDVARGLWKFVNWLMIMNIASVLAFSGFSLNAFMLHFDDIRVFINVSRPFVVS